jgi:hypothetical protein
LRGRGCGSRTFSNQVPSRAVAAVVKKESTMRTQITAIDEMGNVYGRLKVIERAEE